MWKTKVESDKQTISPDDAELLEIDIEMGVGELKVSPTSEDWMNGQFTYSHLVPEVSYNLDQLKGRLKVKQESNGLKWSFNKGYKNKWDLQLTNRIPVKLKVQTGAASSNLDLSSMNLRDVEVQTGVGDLTVDLSKVQQQSFPIHIDCGVGDTTVIVPRETGVEVKLNKGIGKMKGKDLCLTGDGTYVNQAYKNGASFTIDMEIDLGVGNITVEVE